MDRQMEVTKKAMRLAKLAHRFCFKLLPDTERYALSNQMWRSAISVPSNLAEGQKRDKKEFGRFVKIARGSLSEFEIQLSLANEIYFEKKTEEEKKMLEEMESLIDEIGRMTFSLVKKLNPGSVSVSDSDSKG